MKKLLYIGGGVVVLAAAVLVAVFVLSGSLLKSLIEDVGSQATQAKVTVDEVKISPLSGEGALVGLTIGNPKGFKAPQALKMSLVSLKVDTSTIQSDTIVIKEVIIGAPDVTYELGDSGGDNIRTIQKNTQDYASRMGGGNAPAGKPASAPAPAPGAKGDAKTEAKEKKIIIESLWVRGGKVAVTASALGGKPLGTGLPDIHLTNIGKSKGGATPAEVADEVIGAIAKASQTAVTKIGVDQLKGLVGSGADDMMKKLGTQMPSIPGTGSQGSAPAGGSSPTTNPAGAIKNLLGR